MFMWVACLALSFLLPGVADAHSNWVSPVPRSSADNIKVGPCGGDAFGVKGVTKLEPGKAVVLHFTERIQHTGAPWRIALGAKGDTDFSSCILVDHIPHGDGRTKNGAGQVEYYLTVTIPHVSCPECTLQLLSPMTDKISGPTCTYNPLDSNARGAGNDQCFSNYHSCADVSIAGSSAFTGYDCAALAGGQGWPFANGQSNAKTGLNFATNVYAKGEGVAGDWSAAGLLVGAGTPAFFRSTPIPGGGTAAATSPSPATSTNPTAASPSPSPATSTNPPSSTPSPTTGTTTGTTTGSSSSTGGGGNTAGGGGTTPVGNGTNAGGVAGLNDMSMIILAAAVSGGVVFVALVVLISICACYKRTGGGSKTANHQAGGRGGGVEMSGGQAGRAGLPRVKSMAPNFPRPKSIAAMELTGGLPAGWAQAVEEETGDTYYYHEETGETQWEFPMAPRLAPGAPPSTTMHSNPINS